MAASDDDGLRQVNIVLAEFGVQYVGRAPAEALSALEKIRESLAGKPHCFARSVHPDDPVCRSCDEYLACRSGVVVPQFPRTAVDFQECDVCDGDLTVELYNEQGTIVDYGCTTEGCSRTVGGGRGH